MPTPPTINQDWVTIGKTDYPITWKVGNAYTGTWHVLHTVVATNATGGTIGQSSFTTGANYVETDWGSDTAGKVFYGIFAGVNGVFYSEPQDNFPDPTTFNLYFRWDGFWSDLSADPQVKARNCGLENGEAASILDGVTIEYTLSDASTGSFVTDASARTTTVDDHGQLVIADSEYEWSADPPIGVVTTP